jgi:hypothetical protein
MAQRVEHFTLTVPANGDVLDFVTFAGGDGTVDAITAHFPSGCVNKVGVQVFYASFQVIPRTAGAFLRGNDQDRRFDLESFPTGSSWALYGVSTDRYQHKIRFDFEMDELLAGQGARLGLPPLVLMPIDESLVGVIQNFDFGEFQMPAGGGLPTLGGGTVGSSPVIGSQAELDNLRVAIRSASSPQQVADMQARINELVAAGWI